MAASNIDYFTELSYPNIKREINESLPILRQSNLLSEFIQREPSYKNERKKKLLIKAKEGQYFDKKKYDGKYQNKVIYCKKCLYPSLSATPMQFDNNGVCMGCLMAEKKSSITKKTYSSLKEKLIEITKQHKKSVEFVVLFL